MQAGGETELRITDYRQVDEVRLLLRSIYEVIQYNTASVYIQILRNKYKV